MGERRLARWRGRNEKRQGSEEAVVCADAAAFARERLGFTPDVRQEEFLRAEVHRGILNCTRQWGKSTVASIKALHRGWTRPESLILVVSPSDRQSAEFVRKTAAFVRRLGVRPRGDGDNEISLLLPNRSRIVGLPGVERTVRGFSAVSLMLIDEAAGVPDETYRAMRPVLAVGNGDLWLLSTPNGKRGFFWKEWSEGGSEWRRVSVPATECPRISREFLQEERRTHGDRSFRQEYMCEFGEQSAAVFSEDSIMRALKPGLKGLQIPPFVPRSRR